MADMIPPPPLVEPDQWFHALRFPDGRQTPGRFPPDRPPNYSLFGALALLEHMDITKATCLDIGTMDGLMCWSMCRAGAHRIIASDVAERPQFAFAQAQYRYEVEYLRPFLMSDLRKSGSPEYDLIACCGILYHVFDPLPSLITLRRALRTDGLLILETQYLHAEGHAHISFSPGEKRGSSKHANTFFRPSYAALRAMAEIAGFDIVTTIAVQGRLTLLAKAVSPKDIRSAFPMVRSVIDTYENYTNYKEDIDYAILSQKSPSAQISYSGPKGDFALYADNFQSRLGIHAQWEPNWVRRMLTKATDMRFHLRAVLARGNVFGTWTG